MRASTSFSSARTRTSARAFLAPLLLALALALALAQPASAARKHGELRARERHHRHKSTSTGAAGAASTGTAASGAGAVAAGAAGGAAVAGAGAAAVATSGSGSSGNNATTPSSGLTADVYSNAAYGFALRAVYDAKSGGTAFTLVSSASPSAGGGSSKTALGWIGIGTGTEMKGSDMVIGWVNADGSVTLSQRSGTGHKQPSTSIPEAFGSMHSVTSSSGSNGTIFSWTFPAPASSAAPANMAAVPFIWAVAPTVPSSADAGASLRQHTDYGDFTLDLTKAYTPQGTGSGSSATGVSGTTADGGLVAPAATGASAGAHSAVIVAHLLVAIVAWQLVAPAGALVGRWGRTTMRAWFPVHRGVQVAAVVLAVATAALGKWSDAKMHADSGWHGTLGYALAGGAVLQAALGYGGRALFHARRVRALNYVHMGLGLLLLVVAVINIGKGFEVWGLAPRWAAYACYAWGGACALAYAAGLAWGLPRERRRDRQRSFALANSLAPGGADADKALGTPGEIGMGSVDNLLGDAAGAGTHAAAYRPGGSPPSTAHGAHGPFDDSAAPGGYANGYGYAYGDDAQASEASGSPRRGAYDLAPAAAVSSPPQGGGRPLAGGAGAGQPQAQRYNYEQHARKQSSFSFTRGGDGGSSASAGPPAPYSYGYADGGAGAGPAYASPRQNTSPQQRPTYNRDRSNHPGYGYVQQMAGYNDDRV